VNGLQVCKLIVIRVNAHAEEEASIATVHNLVIPELEEGDEIVGQRLNLSQGHRHGEHAYLNEIGLIFLVARRN
jgi:hypothetical protein